MQINNQAMKMLAISHRLPFFKESCFPHMIHGWPYHMINSVTKGGSTWLYFISTARVDLVFVVKINVNSHWV